jgi:allantoinase
MMVQHHPAIEFVTRCMDYFDRVYAESKSRAKIMSIAVHPYISGTPYRIRYFEQVLAALKKKPGVVFWTGEQIMNWYVAGRRERGKRRDKV